jgi:EAL domain-containing protein (putative c-di-GMP-specific phosphodiesterase class I)
MQWVSRLKDALEDGKFILYQQKIRSLSRGSSDDQYSEFLLRMLDADGGTILPGAFIPAAERYGLMVSLDRWVVKAVIDYLVQNDKNKGVYFINLSGASLCDDGLFSFIKQQIVHSGLSPELLCFEITETAAIANLSNAVEFISEIRSIGCQFALDDFGAGLSSFSYLKAIPVDYLKIDGSFVRGIDADPMNYAIVQAINEIGHVAGLQTIAEFVEDEESLELLKGIGVDLAQGYYIERPHSAVLTNPGFVM